MNSFSIIYDGSSGTTSERTILAEILYRVPAAGISVGTCPGEILEGTITEQVHKES